MGTGKKEETMRYANVSTALVAVMMQALTGCETDRAETLAIRADTGAAPKSIATVKARADECAGLFTKGDYNAAFMICQTPADNGDPLAQNIVGIMLINGWGTARDLGEAARWWRKAADQGFAGAQFNLGRMYGKGDGVPQDYAEAVKWYRKAAEQGFAEA